MAYYHIPALYAANIEVILTGISGVSYETFFDFKIGHISLGFDLLSQYIWCTVLYHNILEYTRAR